MEIQPEVTLESIRVQLETLIDNIEHLQAKELFPIEVKPFFSRRRLQLERKKAEEGLTFAEKEELTKEKRKERNKRYYQKRKLRKERAKDGLIRKSLSNFFSLK